MSGKECTNNFLQRSDSRTPDEVNAASPQSEVTLHTTLQLVKSVAGAECISVIALHLNLEFFSSPDLTRHMGPDAEGSTTVVNYTVGETL